jgi:hypothetical protein
VRAPAVEEGAAIPEGARVGPLGVAAAVEERDAGATDPAWVAEADASASAPKPEAIIKIAIETTRTPGPHVTACRMFATDWVYD